jgi:hypothetical protein
VVGRKAQRPYSVKKFTDAKSKEVKTGCNLAESCKEGCGSKRAVLPVMIVMMTM